MSNAPTLAGPARRVRPGTTALVALAVLLLALPALVTVPYFLHLTILALIWMIIAQGQNLIQGYTGYVSIAAGGFMGVGAYCVALLSVKLGWSPWVCLAVAPLLTAALAATRGNQIKAAELLGLNRNTLRKKIRDLDLRPMRGLR